VNTEHDFKTSTFSGNGGNCVEVATTPDGVHVRHSKDRNGGTLKFTTAEWLAFLQGAVAGEFGAYDQRRDA
jgi:hypothetical protein